MRAYIRERGFVEMFYACTVIDDCEDDALLYHLKESLALNGWSYCKGLRVVAGGL